MVLLQLVIMVLYYGAQLGIALSVLGNNVKVKKAKNKKSD